VRVGARGGGAAAVAVGEELLAGGLVLEDVEDAQVGGQRLGAELLLEVGLQLGLLVELLEGAAAGEDAVAELDGAVSAAGDVDLGGDDQQAAGELPGVAQGGGAFGGVLDDVEHEAEIHYVGGLERGVGTEDRVPAGSRDPLGLAEVEVVAVAAAVVEQARAGAEQPVAHGALQRPRQVGAVDRRLVPPAILDTSPYYSDD
jgi:hypothetical protein